MNFLARFFAKSSLLILIWAVALIPVWIFLLTHKITGAEGFWQNFALLGASMFFFGVPQLILFVLGVGLSIVLIAEK